METGLDAHVPTAAPAEAADFAHALIHARRTVLPKRLVDPGPDAHQLGRILAAASAAPDHDQRLPFQFVLVRGNDRAALAQAFADALCERDAAATAEQLAQAREKAFRAPTLLLAVVRSGAPGDSVPLAERILATGCAIQNILLMATACGFGSALTSGKALQSQALRRLFALADDEQALCFVSLGTTGSVRAPRARPAVQDYVRTLGAAP